MARRGRLVVISGPSGVGKTTVCRELLRTPGLRRVVTCTTRPPRAGEHDGLDYRFLSPEEFQRRERQGEFLEHARVHSHRYGTLRDSVLEALATGETVLLSVDVQGARTLENSEISDVLRIFLEPPSTEELRRRLLARGTESEAEKEERLVVAMEELKEKGSFDHVVVNDDLDTAVATIRRLIEQGSHRSERFSEGGETVARRNNAAD